MSDGRSCSRCQAWKTAENFKANPRVRSGLDSWCRPCRAEDARARYRADPEPRKKASRDWHFFRFQLRRRSRDRSGLFLSYGLTVEQFDVMLATQGNVCAACGAETHGGVNWHVDHDHASGLVRAILCHPCNVALGCVQDNPDRLLALAAYLLSFADLLKSSRVHRDVDE